jgi:subtilisin-like proprotein convertase family protein
MDSYRFDALTRSLTVAASRRGALATLLGGTLGLLGPPIAVAKKGKGHKGNKRKARIVRRPRTRTFANTAGIAIGAPGSPDSVVPYPSLIPVSGFANGVITDVNFSLNGVTHTFPDDIDVLLAAPAGQNVTVMSDVGAGQDAVSLSLTLDDQAAPLPDGGPLVSGTFQPTNIEETAFPDSFPTVVPSGNVLLNTFNATDPNGTWQLFVVDDAGGANDSIENGWSLTITAEVDVKKGKIGKGKRGKRGRR